MKVVLASGNKKKIKELREILGEVFGDELEVLSLADVGLDGDIEENGASFAENSQIKANVAASSGYIGIADDSGLVVDALDGAPGIYSARYAGEHGNDAANNAKLLCELDGVPEEKRGAAFVCAVACVFPDGRQPIVVEGRCPGVILTAPRGENGFGYDPLFYIPGLGKSFAELSPEEKNAISHRGRALRKFADAFCAAVGKEEKQC